MTEPRLTVLCDDVDAGTTFFRDVLALPVRQRDAHHVDVELGRRTATLTPRPAPVPSPVPAPGSSPHLGRGPEPAVGQEPAVILEVEVADLREAMRDLRRRGATVLLGPVLTEWGTESAFVAGPDGVVVELYRPRPPGRRPIILD